MWPFVKRTLLAYEFDGEYLETVFTEALSGDFALICGATSQQRVLLGSN